MYDSPNDTPDLRGRKPNPSPAPPPDGIDTVRLTKEFQQLRAAVMRLYYSAHWTTVDLNERQAARLWEDVRDAAGFPLGCAPSPAPPPDIKKAYEVTGEEDLAMVGTEGDTSWTDKPSPAPPLNEEEREHAADLWVRGGIGYRAAVQKVIEERPAPPPLNPPSPAVPATSLGLPVLTKECGFRMMTLLKRLEKLEARLAELRIAVEGHDHVFRGIGELEDRLEALERGQVGLDTAQSAILHRLYERLETLGRHWHYCNMEGDNATSEPELPQQAAPPAHRAAFRDWCPTCADPSERCVDCQLMGHRPPTHYSPPPAQQPRSCACPAQADHTGECPLWNGDDGSCGWQPREGAGQ